MLSALCSAEVQAVIVDANAESCVCELGSSMLSIFGMLWCAAGHTTSASACTSAVLRTLRRRYVHSSLTAVQNCVRLALVKLALGTTLC
jgi:hypothetical protein